MSLQKHEMFSSERREAELNENRKLRLFFRFKDNETRDNALKNIADTREFQDEFKRVIDFGPDSEAIHGHDGLMLRFDQYDKESMNKIRDYFNAQGFDVIDSNEWIIEPKEQEKEREQIEQNIILNAQNKLKIVHMPSKQEIESEPDRGSPDQKAA